jgi:hypothetical protein
MAQARGVVGRIQEQYQYTGSNLLDFISKDQPRAMEFPDRCFKTGHGRDMSGFTSLEPLAKLSMANGAMRHDQKRALLMVSARMEDSADFHKCIDWIVMES